MKRYAVVFAMIVASLFGATEASLAQHQDHKAKSTSQDSSSIQQNRKESAGVNAKVAATVKQIIASYLKLKNALAGDKSNDAAEAGKEIVEALGTLDKSLLTTEQAKLYEDVGEDAREHAEHIGENAKNIGHQREHFAVLSQDVYDLVKTFGAGQLLYKNFCPMYNDKKGAIWLSETKTIKNPYYGKKMLTCGEFQEELK